MKPAILITTLTVFILVSCTHKPEKFNLGKDHCAECKMTIVDPKFGAEIVTKKSKIYKFDDVHCLAQFLKRREVELGSIHSTLLVNYNNNDEFLRINDAELVVSSQFKSPMGGNAAAFKTKAEAQKKSAEMDGSRTTNWATLYNILVK